MEDWRTKAALYPNIQVLQMDESISLGECLNLGVGQARLDYIAKFDDDDYYAPDYLDDAINVFAATEADIVGKRSIYAYFEGSQTLALAYANCENMYVDSVIGATMVIKKEVFDLVHFDKDMTLGEDTQFQKDCLAENIKIYSTHRFNFVCIRRQDYETHTWQVEDNEFLHYCQVVAHTDDYITLATI